jgi:hypothetical protein
METDEAIAAVLNLDYRLIPLSFRPVPFWDEGLNGRFTKATKENMVSSFWVISCDVSQGTEHPTRLKVSVVRK